jgi:hypothetical protein
MTTSRASIGRAALSALAGLAMIVAAAALLGACGGDDEDTTAATTTAATTAATGAAGAELPEDATDAFIENCERSARRSVATGTGESAIANYCRCALDRLSEELSLEEISRLGQEAAETGTLPGEFEQVAEECRAEIE